MEWLEKCLIVGLGIFVQAMGIMKVWIGMDFIDLLGLIWLEYGD